ncbi:MAG TPA: DUF1552 domain-containing protein [Polyangia bacterium]|jgi:hypothetical protein|nr:DUF1552 domain-containing protein [Polyangia bacterium]
MGKFRLSRRAVIRGAGSIAIGLPWLEIMGHGRRASAQTAPTTAQRFLAVFQPGGTVRAQYTPTGTETAPILSPILTPLKPMMDAKKLIIVDGLDMNSAVGEQHQAGIIAWLTGTTQNMPPPNGGTPTPGSNSYAKGPSLDQVIATRLMAQKTRTRKSLEFAVRWATGKSKGLLSPINAGNFEDNVTFAPIPPRLDPVQIWTDLFGSLGPNTGTDTAALLARKRSILDFVDRRFAALSTRLGTADRQKIDQHLTKIRELEQGLATMTVPPPTVCKVPTMVNTSDYNPRTGLNSSDTGSIVDTPTDAAIPKVGMYMMDMMVMAMACDITAVGTMQWSDTEAKHTFPWLNLSEHHHFYQHDGGFRPTECAQIDTWYSQMHLYLLQAMDRIDMGGHTLLDESVVLFGSEIQDPPTHVKTNMPFMLAGRGGGLRGGRWIKYPRQSHNNLLVAILNLFGDTRTTFGDPMYCTGPLNNLV